MRGRSGFKASCIDRAPACRHLPALVGGQLEVLNTPGGAAAGAAATWSFITSNSHKEHESGHIDQAHEHKHIPIVFNKPGMAAAGAAVY